MDSSLGGTIVIDKTTYPFPVFTVTGTGFVAHEELELKITSVPAGGVAGGGARLDYPHVFADANGSVAYGPQYAGVLFPDHVDREITCDFWHVGASSKTTAKV